MKIGNKDLHIGLILSTIVTIILGLTVIYSASVATNQGGNLAFKQMLYGGITIFTVLVILFLDLKTISEMTWFFYLISLGLLVAIFFVGKTSHGAQSWIHLGFFALQPSEFAKIAIILGLAKYMSKNLENNQKLSFIFVSIMIVLIPLGLILKQPDLGTSLTLIPILTSMLFMAGIKKRYFIILLPFAVIPLFVIFLAKKGYIEIQDIRDLLFFLKPYQQNRLLVFIDPNIDPRGMSYNLIQSQIAIGSGGMLGKGFMAGTQTHLQFLPERHTDFVFSVLGEEWGFVGGMVLLFLYFIILRQGLNIALSCDDYFPKLAATGIVILILFHILTNIGMTIGLMPITGLPLPLISYGGSSMLTTMIAIGLLLNFHASKNQVTFR